MHARGNKCFNYFESYRLHLVAVLRNSHGKAFPLWLSQCYLGKASRASTYHPWCSKCVFVSVEPKQPRVVSIVASLLSAYLIIVNALFCWTPDLTTRLHLILTLALLHLLVIVRLQ